MIGVPTYVISIVAITTTTQLIAEQIQNLNTRKTFFEAKFGPGKTHPLY
jgi:hypothetical protein